jgi:hypothetical protein
MAITHQPLVKPTPGDPITAEGWNNIIDAIKTLYAEYNRSQGALTVEVRNGKDKSILKDATVTLIAKGIPPQIAVYAGGKVQSYIAHDLKPAEYQMTVEAETYDREERKIIIKEDGSTLEVTVDMTQTIVRKPVPNLFGLKLAAAEEVLKNAGFLMHRVIDSHGKDLSADDINKVGAEAKVINQVPEANLPHTIGDPVDLLVSAKAAFAEQVTVPELKGMILDEARAALKAANLVLGDTKTIEA